MTKPKTIRLYPVPGVSVYPYPAVEFDATPDEAEFLLAHVPPPFSRVPVYVVGEKGPELVTLAGGSIEKAPSPSETAATASED